MTGYEQEKELFLKFAVRLDKSSDDFFKQFAAYLREFYSSVDSPKFSAIGDQLMAGVHEYLEEIADIGSSNLGHMGCALFGRTTFNKVELVKGFLDILGEDNYEVIDCEGRAKMASVDKLIMKYKDIPIVIVDNCEKIIQTYQGVVTFKHLADDYPEKYGWSDDAPVIYSHYIFLGGTLDPNGVRDHVSGHNMSFDMYCHVHDLDKLGLSQTEEEYQESKEKWDEFLSSAGIKFEKNGMIAKTERNK
jgi:hypothetical protein